MSAIEELFALTRLRVLRWLALTALIVAIGTECFVSKLAVLDPDIWWHLSVGDWIVHNRAFPHTGIFSRTAANRVPGWPTVGDMRFCSPVFTIGGHLLGWACLGRHSRLRLL